MTTDPLDAGYTSYQDGRLAIPPEEPEETPADYLGDCIHRDACRHQWECSNGKFAEGYVGWFDDLAEALGCGEDCMCFDLP